METLGWSARESPTAPPHSLGTFTRMLDEQFALVAILAWVELRSHEITAVARVGLEHARARALLVQLAGSPTSGVILNAPTTTATLSKDESADRVAEELVQAYGPDALETVPRPNVDQVIQSLRDCVAVAFIEQATAAYAFAGADERAREPGSASGSWELSAALLVAAGRYAEAELTLTQQPEASDGDARHRQRFTRQMRRVIQLQGEFALPSTPPQWPVAGAEAAHARESLGSRFSTAYTRAKTERAAMDAVRARAKGRSRDELHDSYERELASRDLNMSAADIDEAVEILDRERQPLGTARLLVNLVKDVRALYASAKSAAADEMTAAVPTPDRAAYPLFGHAAQWSAVELDPAANAVLGQLWGSHRVGFGRTRDAEVWLRRETSCAEDRVTVHVADQRVGRIVARDTERFRPALAAAAERDEDPFTLSRLSMSSSGQSFRLDVPLPAPSATSC